jgi:hypothetical protein
MWTITVWKRFGLNPGQQNPHIGVGSISERTNIAHTHTVMEDFAQGYFLSILQLPLLEHCASYAQLSAWLQTGLQILTCS